MMSADLNATVQGALINLAAGMKGPDTHKMLAAMAELDELLQRHRTDLDPRLAHFLERRSYAKAMEFLAGGRPASGACGTRV